jgi:hypothetical protein
VPSRILSIASEASGAILFFEPFFEGEEEEIFFLDIDPVKLKLREKNKKRDKLLWTDFGLLGFDLLPRSGSEEALVLVPVSVAGEGVHLSEAKPVYRDAAGIHPSVGSNDLHDAVAAQENHEEQRAREPSPDEFLDVPVLDVS